MKNDETIFFVNAKAPKYLGNTYARFAADEQIRKRFYQGFESSPYKMHGISAFGTNVSFYELEKENADGHCGIIRPRPAAKYSEQILVDVIPKNRWDLNILDEQGYENFMEVVEEAKALELHEPASSCSSTIVTGFNSNSKCIMVILPIIISVVNLLESQSYRCPYDSICLLVAVRLLFEHHALAPHPGRPNHHLLIKIDCQFPMIEMKREII
ncbi:uncharacterized protein LACBIDRAFT_303964 [Laccaria bicolor S238N-H82]|nr:uncharacterized protein LACBIDRAFT_303964 [Laccaria bicolor S238N-H82]EDQ98314.1 predicted protein [Laccaria bicolor S238N-H82]|eukprot:XP_001891035.1 predicted protein [Laccaria bicolor S238N-H82]